MIFGRKWELKIKNNPASQSQEFTIKPDENGVSMRMQFSISASTDFRYYTGTVKIFNLGAKKRALLDFNKLLDDFGTGPSVQLSAGYESNFGFIFNGVVHRGYTVREGADWITTLEVGLPFKNDLVVTIPQRKINNLNLYEFIESTVKAVKNQTNRIEITNASDYKENLQSAIDEYLSAGDVKNKSIGYHGSAQQVLAEIQREFSIRFFYDYKGWNVIKVNQDDRNPPVIYGDIDNPDVIFNRDNGLIGSPIRTDTGSKFFVYLRPDLRVFQPVGVRSNVLNRNISIFSLIHRGDTYTDEWYSEIDGANINQIRRR